ncbi:DUF4422 domain-containing protein [Bifidobacterium choloepi]|uniref:DUF4422 domain-containing protein n=1 Tax=Bifidobacterium choloepi TaxID=2614131 RepID=A0A6I5NGD5_9BIFI|nr:DUF4422 domain-containing protein [Bifidobacterium choloepi]NEG70354.1 DUF4422 domain-containing protein [Bifidobacterium choloepi]
MTQAPQETTMFIVAHRDIIVQPQEGYFPILAGASKNNAKILLKDNVGTNISDKNKEYCELTAQYWVWKNYNIKNHNIGFVHYRRFFYTSTTKKSIVSIRQLSRDLQTYDAVLPEPWILRQSVQEQFCEYHYAEDLALTKRIIDQLYPEFVPSFEKVMKGHALCCYNMFVLPSCLFSEYMQWLFDILSHVEAEVDVEKYSDYNRRLFGFLSERLLNVWVDAKKLKCKYYPVYKNDDTWWAEAIKRKVKEILIEHRI